MYVASQLERERERERERVGFQGFELVVEAKRDMEVTLQREKRGGKVVGKAVVHVFCVVLSNRYCLTFIDIMDNIFNKKTYLI
jgi:hypothetical protein